MKMKVLNRLKLGRDVAAEIPIQDGCKGWVWINPTQPRHPLSEMPDPLGKFLVTKFFVPLELLKGSREVDQRDMKNREIFYFDKLEDALEKAKDLVGTTDGFDAPFNLLDFPI